MVAQRLICTLLTLHYKHPYELQLEWISACDLETEELSKVIKINVIMFKIEFFGNVSNSVAFV